MKDTVGQAGGEASWAGAVDSLVPPPAPSVEVLTPVRLFGERGFKDVIKLK